ncbi:hypothetical protein AYI70_g3668 [Smittium culicis]|uniref:Endonuclease/exonuclease/phosphatase domain-containing protein n=1 Tax=Smittium culicis TaxID=133412 RepID=A0A1R1Y2Y3_9FUNG|nr:hypothetical protein AYI70_g3668 [Smittium culicis]
MNNFKHTKIGYWNCQGLSERKWDRGLSAISEAELDILFLAETWFTDHDIHQSHPLFFASSDRILPKPKFGHERAGIICLVSDVIRCQISSAYVTTHTICISINGHDIMAVYFPPSMKVDQVISTPSLE